MMNRETKSSFCEDWVFWGKLDGEVRLPLAHHCIDVGMVFHALTRIPLFRQRLEMAAHSPLVEVQLDRLAVIALLHDIGKANLGFQDKPFNPHNPRAGHVRELAPLFFEQDLSEALTEALELVALASWFDSLQALEGFLLAAWSHHGSPVRFDEGSKSGHYWLAKNYWWCRDGSRATRTLLGA